MKKEIKKIIENIRPSIMAHGGDVEFVDFDEKKKAVKVKLKGACSHCPMATLTLKEGVLAAIQEKYPEIKEIENAS